MVIERGIDQHGQQYHGQEKHQRKPHRPLPVEIHRIDQAAGQRKPQNITYYLRTTIQEQYIGRYPNTYDNKCLLLTAIRGFLSELESTGVLNPGDRKSVV